MTDCPFDKKLEIIAFTWIILLNTYSVFMSIFGMKLLTPALFVKVVFGENDGIY